MKIEKLIRKLQAAAKKFDGVAQKHSMDAATRPTDRKMKILLKLAEAHVSDDPVRVKLAMMELDMIE